MMAPRPRKLVDQVRMQFDLSIIPTGLKKAMFIRFVAIFCFIASDIQSCKGE
jgi:hypothetical protein